MWKYLQAYRELVRTVQGISMSFTAGSRCACSHFTPFALSLVLFVIHFFLSHLTVSGIHHVFLP